MKSNANVLFTFSEPVLIERIYRKPLLRKQILMGCDDVERLIKTLSNHPAQNLSVTES